MQENSNSKETNARVAFNNIKNKTTIDYLNSKKRLGVSPYSLRSKQAGKGAKEHIDTKEKDSNNDIENGDEEYLLCLKNALKDALEENDKLREYILQIESEKKALQTDLEEKDIAITELYASYEYCKKYHQTFEKEFKEKKRKKHSKSI